MMLRVLGVIVVALLCGFLVAFIIVQGVMILVTPHVSVSMSQALLAMSIIAFPMSVFVGKLLFSIKE